MLRIQAVRALLVEEIACIASDDDEPAAAPGEQQRAALEKARRRALAVAILDWAAILVLLLLHQQPESFFTLSRAQETIFSLGILVIAVHSGFRLGNFEKLSTVARAWDDLGERLR